MTYAAKTTVPAEKSRQEIEKLLRRFGAEGFGYASERDRAQLMFRIRSSSPEITLLIRMTIPLPDESSRLITHDGRGMRRSESQRRDALDQWTRQRWRAILLIVKAKLEAVATGISTVEREFLPDVVDPSSGRTVEESVLPALSSNYLDPSRPPLRLLPGAQS